MISRDASVFWKICSVLAIFSLYVEATLAHGGVSIEDDTCIMTIGSYKAHFTGYQPKVRASQEFCEDIPTVSNSIIVLDFVNRPLRDMLLDFRIVRDVNEIGENAQISDLGTTEDIEAATIYYKEPKRYQGGSLSAEYQFRNKGRFIGILTASSRPSEEENRSYTSVFPFSVGLPNWWKKSKGMLAALSIGIVLYFGFRQKDRLIR